MARKKKISITDPTTCEMFSANFKSLLEHTNETPNSIRLAKEKIKSKEDKWRRTHANDPDSPYPRTDDDIYYDFWPSYSVLSHCNSFLEENTYKSEEQKWFPTMEITAKLVKVYNKYVAGSHSHKITTEDFLTQRLTPSYNRDVLPMDPDRYFHDYYVYYRYGSSTIYSGALRLQAGRHGDAIASLVFNNHDNRFLYTDQMLQYLDVRATKPDTEAEHRLAFYDGTCTLGRDNLTIMLTGRYDRSQQLMIVMDVSEFHSSHYNYYYGGVGLALNSNGTKEGSHAFKLALADAARFKHQIWPNVSDEALKDLLTFRFNSEESIPCPKDDDARFFKEFLAKESSRV